MYFYLYYYYFLFFCWIVLLPSQMMNEEEVEDLAGLESSMTRAGGAYEGGVEGHSTPQAGSGEDPTVASTPAQ
jgi:hypothetical protein